MSKYLIIQNDEWIEDDGNTGDEYYPFDSK